MPRYTFIAHIKVIIGLCLLLIACHILNITTGGKLASFGIYPRTTTSLSGIFLAPFIHGSWYHLFSNLIGMTIFSTITLLKGKRYFFRTSAYIIIVTGSLVWLFARDAMHIGASGWLFGLWSLAIATAFFQRNFTNIVIAVGVIFFYGGMVFGIFPSHSYISYESHFFGAIAGVSCAYFSKRKLKL